MPLGLTRRAGTCRRCRRLVPYLVLLRVGFTLPPPLPPERCALTAPFHPYPNLAARAVCFLWHSPSLSLNAQVPDVIRHTALRSPDFPPPQSLRPAAAAVQSACAFILSFFGVDPPWPGAGI